MRRFINQKEYDGCKRECCPPCRKKPENKCRARLELNCPSVSVDIELTPDNRSLKLVRETKHP